MVENAGFVPKDASVAKRVWYGVGKAVESQSPKAWEARILRVIDKQIIPKLSPENQKWAQEVRPKVEKFAKVAGVAIPVVEVVAVVGSTVVIGKKVKEGIRIHKNKVFEKKFKKRYGFAIGDETVRPIDFVHDPRFVEAWSKTLSQKQEAVTPFTQWLADTTKEFSQKYGPISTHRMEQTIRQMSVAIGRNEKGMVPRWRSIIETAQKGSPAAVERAKRTLQKVFTDAYIQSRGGVDRRANPQRAFLMDMMARDAFAKWENVQFPGLPDLLNEGARYPSSRVGVIEEIVPKFWQDAKDFEVIDRSPPPFEQVLSVWRGADREMLLEMAEDPKWTRAVELLPSSPWGDILDPNSRLYKAEAPTIPYKPTFHQDKPANAATVVDHVEAPPRELSWWEKRDVDKLQRVELRLRKEKYGPRNLERKYRKETARLRAKQTDQAGTITYRQRLDELANPAPQVEVLSVEPLAAEVPAGEIQTPEQILAQENARWLSKIREIAKRRGQSPYGKRFSQIIDVNDGVIPQDIPETPPFIDRMQQRREAARLSEDFATPSKSEDLGQWWKDREELGLSTSTLQEQAQKEHQDIVDMLARDEAQRQATRLAETLRVETRRANRDPLATTLNYVFRGEQTPDRQQWFARVLMRAQEIAEHDVVMQDLLAVAGAINAQTTLERIEEANVLAKVFDRAFQSLPKGEQDWQGYRKSDSGLFFTMASDLVGRFHKAETPLSLIQGVKSKNGGDMLINRLLVGNDKTVSGLVRKLASVGTNRGERVEVFEPTQELVDLFTHAYRTIAHVPQSQPLTKTDVGIIRRIATQFVRRKDSPIAKLYAKYPNPDWPKDWVDRMK